MKTLVDSNIWLALMSADHLHHHVAANWFDSIGVAEAVICRPVHMSVLRLLSNPLVTKHQISSNKVWTACQALFSDDRVVFVPEPDDIEDTWIELMGNRRNSSNWMDSYLAAFAIQNGFRLITFDRGFQKFPRLTTVLLTP